jgi:quercetin dioxygenase-like cupin family protein
MDAYSLKPDEGWTYNFDALGIDFVVKAGEFQSTNGAAVFECVTRKGEEPGDHTHPTEDEMFYVLEGELTFRCGDRTFDVGTGGFALLPRGVEHNYAIRSDGPVRLLVVTAPPREPSEGWDGFVASFESSAKLVSGPPGIDQ